MYPVCAQMPAFLVALKVEINEGKACVDGHAV